MACKKGAAAALAAFGLMLPSALAQDARLGRLINGNSVQTVFTDPQVASLVKAACDGEEAIVQSSVAKGVDPNASGRDGITPLFWALSCDNLRGIEALLKAGARPNDYNPRIASSPPRGGVSPTLIAAGMQNPTILRLLLAHGGDPNAAEVQGPSTALKAAFRAGLDGNWDNYYFLLKNGADMNRPQAGITVAEEAVAQGRFDKALELLSQGYNHDLESLGGFVQARMVYPPSPAVELKYQIVAVLEQKGVRFPVLSELEKRYSGMVFLSKNRTMRIVVRAGSVKGRHVDVQIKILEPQQPGYDEMLAWVEGIEPGGVKNIPRRPEDPVPDTIPPGLHRPSQR